MFSADSYGKYEQAFDKDEAVEHIIKLRLQAVAYERCEKLHARIEL